MRKKIHKFPSKVLNQLLYKSTVIADGYYLQYIMDERIGDEILCGETLVLSVQRCARRQVLPCNVF